MYSHKKFTLGESNPTYQLTGSDGSRYVLRKKPPLKLINKKIHWIEREYKILHALKNSGVPVPDVYCLSVDESVIGTPFYIMEFLDGRVSEAWELPGVSPEDRKDMWMDATRNLAKLHTLDVRTLDLKNFGQPARFYERQLSTITAITEAQAQIKDAATQKPIGPIMHSDELFSFFKTHRKRPREMTTLIHGDFKIDNIVFHKTEPRVIGFLDWEISSFGHPISDLAHFLTCNVAASVGVINRRSSLFIVGVTPGLPSADEVLGWYKEFTGWDPRPDLAWASAFDMLKLSVICQGIKARKAFGQSSTAAEEHIKNGNDIAETARRLIVQIEKTNKPRLML
ncbi:Acyl-CoA dehydrogenase family member [Lachnellula suecica]|uniref:Acyl-CoA dehydrogenase family member n=1 Tax=Lachnellula suecica TaxID=602035 RepID=A0A8T9C9B3_9HELO|nr:Acyl-CoA dehydrogenase family member [Lachnellula suecica]